MVDCKKCKKFIKEWECKGDGHKPCRSDAGCYEYVEIKKPNCVNCGRYIGDSRCLRPNVLNNKTAVTRCFLEFNACDENYIKREGEPLCKSCGSYIGNKCNKFNTIPDILPTVCNEFNKKQCCTNCGKYIGNNKCVSVIDNPPFKYCGCYRDGCLHYIERTNEPICLKCGYYSSRQCLKIKEHLDFLPTNCEIFKPEPIHGCYKCTHFEPCTANQYKNRIGSCFIKIGIYIDENEPCNYFDPTEKAEAELKSRLSPNSPDVKFDEGIPEPEERTCIHCLKDIPFGAKFCSNCGHTQLELELEKPVEERLKDIDNEMAKIGEKRNELSTKLCQYGIMLRPGEYEQNGVKVKIRKTYYMKDWNLFKGYLAAMFIFSFIPTSIIVGITNDASNWFNIIPTSILEIYPCWRMTRSRFGTKITINRKTIYMNGNFDRKVSIANGIKTVELFLKSDYRLWKTQMEFNDELEKEKETAKKNLKELKRKEKKLKKYKKEMRNFD